MRDGGRQKRFSSVLQLDIKEACCYRIAGFGKISPKSKDLLTFWMDENLAQTIINNTFPEYNLHRNDFYESQ